MSTSDGSGRMDANALEAVPSERTSDDRSRHTSRLRRTLLTATVLLVGGFLVNYQLQPFDPYRPGTSHPVAMTRDAVCINLGDLSLDGRIWVPRGTGAVPKWVALTPGTVSSGSLVVTARDEAELHLDVGVTVLYTRQREGVFSNMLCSLG